MPSPTTVERIAATAADLAALPNDLLEDIFLRLDDAADLARASTCCTSFRGIITGRRFLRRYQSIPPPPVLGFLDCTCTSVVPEPGDTDTPGLDDAARRRRDRICAFYQAESSPAASQLARAADFTFPFLPDLEGWNVSDFRDGRVLLSGHAGADNSRCSIFKDLVVYDPLHRRHIQLPAIPRETKRHRGGVTHVEAFLVPVTDKDKDKEKDEDHLPFAVICNVYTKEKIWAYIFSSATGRWRAPTNAVFAIGEYNWFRPPLFTKRHYACGCFFWTAEGPTLMLALEMTSDGSDMKFSIVDLPYEFYFCQSRFAVVEAAEGRLGLLLLGHEQMLNVYSKSMQDGVGAGEWRCDKSTRDPLPSGYHVLFMTEGGAAKGYVLIRAFRLDQFNLLDPSCEEKPDGHYFTLEVETLQLERLCVQKYKTWHDFPYASFPPPLSLPSI